MHWLLTALILALQAQTPLPPAYPRPGTINLIDNDRVLVWDISWLKQTYPLHRHLYDLVGVYYTDGDRVIVNLEGNRRPVSTKAWETAFQRGGVTHIEEGASDAPLKAVFVEIKADGPRPDSASAAAAPVAPSKATQRFDNERATVRELLAPIDGTSHTHRDDAVVVSFKAGKASAEYVPRGRTHSDGDRQAERVYVFELK